MINIQIPKDIREYETRFIGPFTARETGSIAIASVMVFLGVEFETKILHMPVVSYIPPLIPALIPLFFGFGEKGLRMKPEVYLMTVFRNQFIVPKHRPFKTHNLYDIMMKDMEQELKEDGIDTDEDDDIPEKSEKQKEKERKRRIKELNHEFRAYQ